MNSNPPALYDALCASPIGRGLTPEQAKVLASLVTLQSFRRQEVLASEGSLDNRLIVVVDGALGVVKNAGAPHETLLTVLHPGDLAHELGFLDGTPRFASLVASEDTRVLVLERESLESLVDSHPRILYEVMCAIVRAVHRVQTRLSVQATELTNYIVKQHGRY